ncbi:MAG: UDP-N-acetylglucosamine 2-epimerase (non-hydrolyzing) [Planctomycetota bacterium]
MSSESVRIACIVGARPNFMKAAPLVSELRSRGGFEVSLIHTGQHYDERMSQLFFEELGIPEPDVNLGVGSGSAAEQLGQMIPKLAGELQQREPHLVIVVGDVNSTLAASLAASKLDLPLAHVEAGLRSFDRGMPEEINRVLTDAASDYLFISEPSGEVNLLREGFPEDCLHLVGNVMIDTLLEHRERAKNSKVLAELGLEPRQFAVTTLHRPANVDDESCLAGLLDSLVRISERLPIAWPLHPRTRARLETFGLMEKVESASGLRIIPPVGYLDFLHLMDSARLILTDSGGIQEESSLLGVPCLTLRNNTERPLTLECGTNRLVGTSPEAILSAAKELLDAPFEQPELEHALWDGRAAARVVDVLEAHRAALLSRQRRGVDTGGSKCLVS